MSNLAFSYQPFSTLLIRVIVLKKDIGLYRHEL